jgi:hypothetical protein
MGKVHKPNKPRHKNIANKVQQRKMVAANQAIIKKLQKENATNSFNRAN